MNNIFHSLLIKFLLGLRLILGIIIGVLCIGFLLQFVSNASHYSLTNLIMQIESRYLGHLINIVREAVPTRFWGVDFSALFTAVIFMLISDGIIRLTDSLQFSRQRQLIERDYSTWRSTHGAQLGKKTLQEIDSRFKGLQQATGKDRKRLLEEFIHIKGQLDSMGQQLAFLAMDVVDSTGMKRDEDKHIAAWDFERYNLLVNQCLSENGVVKFAMTPDGIMSCFRSVDDAVSAAQCVLSRLEGFNREERKIKTPFRVRFGINAGFVYIDDDTPLEQVSDRVIDIAGHMQKHAQPDAINIAASAIEPLKMRGGFKETENIIDEQRVYVWSGKDSGVAMRNQDSAK